VSIPDGSGTPRHALLDARLPGVTLAGRFRSKAIRLSRRAAERTIALDGSLAEAHAILGMILSTIDWHWQGAAREFRKALELEPGNAYTLSRMAALSQSFGRFDEAVALGRRAVDQDPVHAGHCVNLASYYYYLRRFPEAMSADRKAIDCVRGCQWLT
jgi:tetratricopeptide (TPR) repeat protein